MRKLCQPRQPWHRPVSRTYAYNMDVGENYYQPLKDFVDHRERGQSPGAMDFGERLLYSWPAGRICGGDRQNRSSRANSTEETCSYRVSTSPPSSTVLKGFTACELEADKGFRLRQLEAAKAVAVHGTKAAAAVAQELNSIKTTLDRVASNPARSSQFSTIRTTSNPSVAVSRKESLEYSQALQPRTTHVHQGNTDVPSYNRYHAIKTHVMDDICKKIADIHMAPFQYGSDDLSPTSSATQARWNRVNQLEDDLGTLMEFKSHMAYKSSYSKSAARMIFAL